VTDKAIIICYAKINLFLDVLFKRPDGYHNIETIFQSISLHDEIDIALVAGGLTVTCNDPSVPADETNLACKAYRAFAETVGYRGGIEIVIRKSIPAGAGLGGGSSDAAAMLATLNQILRAGLCEDELRDIARDVGADVPFFLSGGLAAAWGIGDRIMQLTPLPETFMVVAIPQNLMVSTATAYDAITTPACAVPTAKELVECTERFRHIIEAVDSAKGRGESPSIDSILYNAFEKPIFQLYPEIAQLKSALLEAGSLGALMSGTGSAVFGLGESLNHVREIREIVSRKSGCQCFIAGTVNRGWELDKK
jgi:4-diphosphocytidyl-2-C-methyl-D-erythritol kinase